MITLKNTEDHYGIGAMLLHWVIALLIIGMLVVGLTMINLPVGLEKLKLFGWHKEFGILILVLAIIRVIWWLMNIMPALPSVMPYWQKLAARAVHFAFYIFMFAMPITGWLISSAAGLQVSVFGLITLPNLIAPDDSARILFAEIHKWLAYSLIAAICLHVGAALQHYFIDKDDVLQKMLP